MVIGTNTCGLVPSVVPSKPRGATPTIVSVCPLTMSCWLSALGSAREPAQPVGMAQDGHVRFTDRPVVFRSDQAAQRRRQLEHREIAARHQHSRSAERLSLIGEVRAEDPMRRHAGEGRLHALEVAKHRVAEDFVAVARLIARMRARLGTGRRKVDQPIRLGHRQRLEEDLVETGKDRGVRADAERQRHNRDDRDERGLEERPEGELRVDHGLGP